jgi:co-chaperonin GroES (HSP10)
VTAGANPMVVKRGIEQAVATVVAELEKHKVDGEELLIVSQKDILAIVDDSAAA